MSDPAKSDGPGLDAELYRALFSATQEGLLVVNDEGRYIEVNDAYATLVKSTRDAVVGRHFADFIPPDRLAEAAAAFEALKEKGRGVPEFPLRAVDGSVVECEWTVHRHFLPGLSLCSARNISARKQAERGLIASEARFRFLTALDDAARPLTEPGKIVQTMAGLLGEYLAVDSLTYCHFEADQETFTITGEYRRGAAPSVLGRYSIGQFGPALADSLQADRPFVVEDTELDPRTRDVREAYGQMGIRANLAVPLHKAGRLAAAMGMHQLTPRTWLPEEVELVQLVANRCWESIERARIERRFQRQTHSFDAVLSNLPDLICSFDRDGRFTYANPALLQVWQKTLDEIIGKNTFDLGYPTELAERIQSEVQVVIKTGRTVRNNTPFTGGAGETRVYEYIFSPVQDGDPGLDVVICTARDITEREQMQKEVTASRERLEQLLAQAPVAIVVVRGEDLTVEVANPFYRELAQGRELVGIPLTEALPELDAEVFEALRGVLRTGVAFKASDWHVPYDQNGDGIVEDHWFTVVYHPFSETDGSVSRVIAVCSEVTAQMRARMGLEAANRELEEFAYVASHDLQEPLRMVAIYTELLVRRHAADNPEAQRYADFIRGGVERMEHLIRDLLDYSRVTHTEIDALDRADLNESLGQAMETMEARIAEAKARVEAGPLPAVRGDTSQFVHVFQNLLSNSLKYRREAVATHIRISARREGATWNISVEDNGIGFEPQYAQRIFGLFKRLHQPDEYSGTGLGLAICQRIIDRCGGRIWAEGRPGQGATIHIALPAADGK